MLKQVYINKDVLTAAKERISYIFDNFENVCVSISGGKDSTVLAHLTLTEAHRRNRKVGIFFLDEEVVYESTINQIRYIMNLYPENTIKLWYQIEFNLTNSTSFEDGQLKCWEKGKHKIWMRSKEADSIQHKPWPIEKETVRDKNKGFGFYDVIENFQNSRENTAFLVGLRATESPNRWRAVSKNPSHGMFYATGLKHGNVSAYPLYDWNFHDIWKYIYDNKLNYSKIYDYQWKKGMGLQEIRVSSLIHEKSFKSLVELPEFEPKTYDKLLKRIKGISIGNLYGKDNKMLRARKLPKNYKSWLEYKDFLLKTYPDESKKHIFEKRFSKHLNNNYVARQQCRQLILNDYENNLPVDNKPDPREETIKKWRELL
ncbi:phosphoadenosine phosphosulfate reductase family protein [Clostridium botulinum]|uniref:phosphoadenosine phosphosulfate reductase domain-containing protein n=1 Tax=Clostridium botulinum TaxID=1491 RepID=UPI001E64111B|nr:phosphoadenosine phosphosulfate reductase family protein [Clostridium botulinum]MCD3202826.1 phosphoadenosine phosphosulfate reductase family protein [Clostridium botulinum C/D]MCD3230886.1 phosphoadenosine phosphosulfate reductase family protein [Clostridium botulinum C/D]MCD3253928.1 phosphoadenosine phosphosulfate reductase family protein [Clostridium botulinum C/D]MCD3279476.1 phosphoadenosine phosphosulfate reductase family protein [Clostridium botulinum C/D]MCD3281631.1 phosphoadenosi